METTDPLMQEIDRGSQPRCTVEATPDSDISYESFFNPEAPVAKSRLMRVGKQVLGLSEVAWLTFQTAKRNQLPPSERMDEILDRRLYTGEATGFERSVRLLGREYAGNGPPVVVTKPLGVKFPGYMSDHVAEICPRIERPMLVIGSVGFNEQRRYSRADRNMFHMSWMAADVHSIINQVQNGETGRSGNRDWPELDFSLIDCTGASQGAVVGLELIAQAKYFDREIGTAALVAPAGLEEAWKIRFKQLKNLALIARQFGFNEPLGLLTYLSKASPEERRHIIENHLPTLSLPRSAMVPVVATAIEFLNGPMRGIGKALRDGNNDTRINISLFNEDTVSTPEKWKEELAEVPGVNIDTFTGGHHAIIKPATNDYVVNALNDSFDLVA